MFKLTIEVDLGDVATSGIAAIGDGTFLKRIAELVALLKAIGVLKEDAK